MNYKDNKIYNVDNNSPCCHYESPQTISTLLQTVSTLSLPFTHCVNDINSSEVNGVYAVYFLKDHVIYYKYEYKGQAIGSDTYTVLNHTTDITCFVKKCQGA